MSRYRFFLHLSSVCRTPRLARAAIVAIVPLSGCGPGAPPPVATLPATPVAAAAAGAPVDVTAVPEPAGLVLVGRVAKPNAILKTASGWTGLPLPGGADLLRSISDDAVGDAVDLSQPVDGAVVLGGSKRDPKPLVAVSMAVRSFDDARAKLGGKHALTAGTNGQVFVDGIGRSSVPAAGARDDADEDDGTSCVLAHASSGARLVCGERDALDALSPYLTRTVPRRTWASDIHLEMTLAAVREPLMQVRAGLPFLAKSVLGSSSPALGELIDAGVTELVDIVDDTGRVTLDAQIADAGLQATMKVDFASTKSLSARLATSHPERADTPPPAFWRLPADTDLAFYERGSDSGLFDRPRELLGNVALELAEGSGMPETERKAFRDLVAERMTRIFTGALVYGKGYDAAAVGAAMRARSATKSSDAVARDEANRRLAEQGIGWHLVQISEPITNVGPILKEWSQLWNRPAFTAWATRQASAKRVARLRIAPSPAGVALPKDTVHLEIVVPREDLYESHAVASRSGPSGGPAAAVPSLAYPASAGAKRFPAKPLVFHVLAVPDQGVTWIGFGMDEKLLARKAAGALSSSNVEGAATLGASPAAETLRATKANAACLVTLRGLLIFTAINDETHGTHGLHSPFAALGQLPTKGETPMVFTSASQAPSPAAAGGSATATFRLPREAIEDMVKLAMSSSNAMTMPH